MSGRLFILCCGGMLLAAVLLMAGFFG